VIIAFYPGAGGNRYLRMLAKLDWQESNVTYDSKVHIPQYLENRYLLANIVDHGHDYILTHCLNSRYIMSKFPKHSICLILGDLNRCLQREWILAGHNRQVKRKIKPVIDRIVHYNIIKDSSWPDCLSTADLDKLPIEIVNEINQDLKKILLPYQPDVPLNTIKNEYINKIDSANDIIDWHLDYYSKYPIDLFHVDTIIDIRTGTDIFSITMQKELQSYNDEIFNKVWDLLI
jgi:hypothetical protein